MSLPTGFDAFAESWLSDSIHLVVSRVENPERQPGLWEISILGGTPRSVNALIEQPISTDMSASVYECLRFTWPKNQLLVT